MAVTVRRLVEDHPKFKNPRVAIATTQQIPVSNDQSFTTIGSLYDILKLVFAYVTGWRSDRLRFNRPDDEKLEMLFGAAVTFFEALEDIAPSFRTYFSNSQPKVGKRLRSSAGGHLLFRPIGLEIVTRSAIALAKARHISITDAVRLLAPLPMQLDAEPFRGIVWDSDRGIILSKGKPLAIRLVGYMLGGEEADRNLLADFRRARGFEPTDASIALPGRLYPDSSR
jgi:DNA sulfur modification protein DndB